MANWRGAILVFFSSMIVCLSAAYGGWYYRFAHRPQPPSEKRQLFQGISYVRDVRRQPRPLIIHVVTVDLNARGIKFLVTPGDRSTPRPLRAQTTSRFLQKYGAQVAVNGDYFFPFSSDTLLHYYPHEGDPVELEGFAASRGIVYSSTPRKDTFPTLYLSPANEASFHKPKGPVYNAISGLWMIVKDGKYCVNNDFKPTSREPYNAVALDRTGRKLLIIVVDGRQPNYSEGVTMEEFSELIRQYGGWNALDLDGGGSETLVMQARNGAPVPLNESIDCGIPGRERFVANHLGIFAARLP